MGKQYKKFGEIYKWVLIVVFIIRCMISMAGIIELWKDAKLFRFGYTLFGYAGEAIGITSLIMLAFNYWLWRLKYINKYISKTPVLFEKYVGTFKSSYDDVVREGELTIRQTFLKINITFRTGESFSDSILASIEEIHGVERLVYTYINEPRGELRDRSPLHYGTASLRIGADDLQGDYYNDRKCVGSMDMKRIVSRTNHA